MSAIQLHNVIQQANIFQTMFEELPVGIALTDPAGRIIYTNKKFSTLAGCGQELLKSQPIDQMVGTDEMGKPVTRIFRESNQQQLDLCNWYIVKGDEKIAISLVVNKLSQFLCFTAMDDSAQLESLRRHNQELDRSNQELSQYAYVASHDLQEPLRKIKIFSDILGNNNKIPAKEKFIVQKINKAAERMTMLITDLLNYSKLVKQDMELEPVDLQQVLRDVLVDFEVTIQERKAIVRFSELPTIAAVKLQMNQLFHNLLGNALKFTPADQSPVIEIKIDTPALELVRKHFKKSDPVMNYILISFHDNGIGFDKKDSEKIFEVFKRLYTGQLYQGSGIGLALCRRIVQNNGGVLYADSHPGEGSVFNIILPVKKPAPSKQLA